jgi:SET domain-containing protein
LQGLGVFVAPDCGFKTGDLVSPYFGILTADRHELSAEYGMDMSDASGGRECFVDARDVMKSRVSRYVNASRRHFNAKFVLAVVCKQRCIVIQTCREIHGGEEICVNYGKGYELGVHEKP